MSKRLGKAFAFIEKQGGCWCHKGPLKQDMKILSLTLIAAVLSIMPFIGAAQAAVSSPTCALKSEGIFQGAWVKHRIYVNEEAVYGANDMDSIRLHLENLREEGLCR